MVTLAYERPGVPPEVLSYYDRVSRYKQGLFYDVKVWLEAGAEHSHAGWIVAILRVHVTLDPWIVRAVRGDKVLIVHAPLCQSDRMTQWKLDGLLILEEVVQVLRVFRETTGLVEVLPVLRKVREKCVPGRHFHWHIGVSNHPVPRRCATLAGRISSQAT